MKASEIKNLKIAIVGAGYGGAAAAKALSLLGADVTVYEQATRMREVGAGIGLRPATMTRFRQWGHFRRNRQGELAERLLRNPHRHRRAHHEGHLARVRRREADLPHPPRRLHRGPARRAPRGHGAARPQAGDHRGQGWPLRPRLHQRADRRGRSGGRCRRHQVSGARAAVQQQGPRILRRARLPRGDLRRRRPRHGGGRQPADVHGQGHQGLPAAAAPPQPDVLRHHSPEPGRHLGAHGH
jgi:choline dehydrogenase-like flavoprotein